MLEAELQGESYKKSEHRKALIPLLAGDPMARSSSSTRTSARPGRDGAALRRGLQAKGELSGIARHGGRELPGSAPWLPGAASRRPDPEPQQHPATVTPDLSQIIVDPPEKIIAPTRTDKPWLSRRGQKIDFAEKDAANRKLGKLGEEFVYTLERHRLKEAGRDDLALKVQWVSQTIGDGLGFDILSFDEADDSERMLEVKATGLGQVLPVLCDGERGPLLGRHPGPVPPVPGLQHGAGAADLHPARVAEDPVPA